jgi:uncharacterized protein YjdB
MNIRLMQQSTFLQWTLRMLFIVALAGFTACGDDDDDDDPGNGNGNGNNGEAKALKIEDGSQSLDGQKGESHTFSAVIVDSEGNTSAASNVSWEVENADVASISANGQVTANNNGVTYVTASVEANGQTLEATVPLRVTVPSPFTVAPWAVIMSTDEEVQLEPVYLNPGGSPSYSYSSSSSNVVSVSNDGLLTAAATGRATVTVEAQINGNTLTQQVPVLVVGVPSVSLPVTRVKVDPKSGSIFRDETLQFQATALDAEGNARNDVDFSWSVGDESIAAIDDSGLLTGEKPGQTTVKATARGITGEASIEVKPDTVVVLDPVFASVEQGASQTFTATVYNAKNGNEITSHADLNWAVPDYPSGFEQFEIGTIANITGSNNTQADINVKDDAFQGLSAPIVAQVGNSPFAVGAALVQVAVGGGGGGDCGQGHPDVTDVRINNETSVTISAFGGSHQIDADPVDAQGNVVSDAELTYFSSNQTVADVDFTGQVNATGQTGSATITVCNGDAQATVDVTVQ